MIRYVLVSGDLVRTGGMDIANFALAIFLARMGVDVHVVAHRVADELLAYPNVRFHRVAKPANAYTFGAPLLASAGLAAARGPGVRVVTNGGNCPAAGLNWVHYVHAAFRPKSTGGKLRSMRQSLTHALSTRTERLAFARARIVVANSENTRQELVNTLGLDPAKVRTVYYGIDADRFKPPRPEQRERARRNLGWEDGRPRVAFVGALGDHRKGFDVLFDAWRALCKTPHWDAELVVIGHGAELPMWRSRAERAGLQRQIEFLGFRQDVPDVLAACDALVAPTRYEAFGLGVLEAACCGLPTIVSARAGVAEVLPAELRELHIEDPEDARSIASLLERWRSRHAAFGITALEASAKLRSRTWDSMAAELLQLLEKLN